MAVYRLNDPESWLPTFARGKGLSCSLIRIRRKDGATVEIPLDGNHETSEVTDQRSIRHLDADPRFTKVS